MKVNIIKLLGLVVFAGMLLAGRTGLAQRTKVVVILDVKPFDETLSAQEIEQLTEAVYAAATEVSPEFYSVVSRDKLLSLLASPAKTGDQGERSPTEIGTLLGADMVFYGELRRPGEGRLVATLKLFETGSGRILGLERAEAADLDTLWGELRKVTRQMLLPLVTGGLAIGAEAREGPEPTDRGPAGPIREPDFLIQFRTSPAEAEIYLDGREICDETPCSYRVEPGDHELRIKARHYKTDKKRVIIDSDRELSFRLEPKKYNYFGMHDADRAGYGVTVGISPLEKEYKTLSVLSGSEFGNLHPVFDVGSNGEIFGYRQTAEAASWSILGFGPSFRIGRIMISSQVQLLSFRRDSDKEGGRDGGWQPGVTNRVQIPLINSREARKWTALIPTPAAGFDVWFDDLDYDQYHFWLGLSWLGGVGF